MSALLGSQNDTAIGTQHSLPLEHTWGPVLAEQYLLHQGDSFPPLFLPYALLCLSVTVPAASDGDDLGRTVLPGLTGSKGLTRHGGGMSSDLIMVARKPREAEVQI